MGERLQKFRSQRLDLLNKDREYQAFEVGQIVYMFHARAVLLKQVVGKSDAITLGHCSYLKQWAQTNSCKCL